MQEALEQNKEVSDACKAEIREAIQGSEFDRSGEAEEAEAPNGSDRWIPPTLIILAFVAAAVGGLVYYIMEENKKNPVVVRGPRSKKKEERDRRRGR